MVGRRMRYGKRFAGGGIGITRGPGLGRDRSTIATIKCKQCGGVYRYHPLRQFCDACKVEAHRLRSLHWARATRGANLSRNCAQCGTPVTRKPDKGGRYSTGPLPKRCKKCARERKAFQKREWAYHHYRLRKQGSVST